MDPRYPTTVGRFIDDGALDQSSCLDRRRVGERGPGPQWLQQAAIDGWREQPCAGAVNRAAVSAQGVVEALQMRPREGGRTTAGVPKPATNAAMEVMSGRWFSGPDDEAVHVIQIPVTRRQVHATMVAVVILGLVAASASALPVGAAGLAVAAGVTFADQAPVQDRQ